MKHLKFFFLISMCLTLANCKTKDLKGSLQLDQNLALLRETSAADKKYSLNAGEYISTVQFDSQKHLLTLKVTDHLKNPTFKFKVPKEAQLANDQGDFFLSSEQSGQPVDLKGVYTKTISQGPTVNKLEECILSEHDVICTPRPEGSNCFPNGNSRIGNRDVKYHLITTHNQYAVEILKDQVLAGKYNIESETVEKKYTYRGFCR